MVSRITAALAARYKAIQEKEKGFTLIELLVVVIIIGVLAAIAIPIYMGVQDNAKDSAVKSDLTNAKIAVVAYQTETGDWPAAGDLTVDTLGKYGYTESDETDDLKLTKAPTDTDPTFCIDGIGTTKSTFSITDSAGTSDEPCTATSKED